MIGYDKLEGLAYLKLVELTEKHRDPTGYEPRVWKEWTAFVYSQGLPEDRFQALAKVTATRFDDLRQAMAKK